MLIFCILACYQCDVTSLLSSVHMLIFCILACFQCDVTSLLSYVDIKINSPFIWEYTSIEFVHICDLLKCAILNLKNLDILF